MLGLAVGHLYYFLEDVYPRMIPSRTRLLKAPYLMCVRRRGGLGVTALGAHSELLFAAHDRR
jgi:hypothetical protein